MPRETMSLPRCSGVVRRRTKDIAARHYLHTAPRVAIFFVASAFNTAMTVLVVSGFGCSADMYSLNAPVFEWWKQNPSIRTFCDSIRGYSVIVAHSAGVILLAYAIRFNLLSSVSLSVIAIDSHLAHARSTHGIDDMRAFLRHTHANAHLPRVARLQKDAILSHGDELCRWRTYIRKLALRWYSAAPVRFPLVRSWHHIQCTRNDFMPFIGTSSGNNHFLQDLKTMFGAKVRVVRDANHYQIVFDARLREEVCAMIRELCGQVGAAGRETGELQIRARGSE